MSTQTRNLRELADKLLAQGSLSPVLEALLDCLAALEAEMDWLREKAYVSEGRQRLAYARREGLLRSVADKARRVLP